MKHQRIIALLSLGLLFLPLTSHAASSCSLQTGEAYQSSQSTGIYYITESCTKQLFRNDADFFTYFSSKNDIKRTDDLTLRFIPNDANTYVAPKATTGTNTPTGTDTETPTPQNPTNASTPSNRATTLIFKDGSVVKSRSRADVYLVINNVKYHIENGETFTELGLRPQWIEIVPDKTLDAVPSGSSINMFPNSNLMSQAAVNYMLFKDKNSANVYRVEPGTRDPKYQVLRKITNETAFRRLNYRADRLPAVTIVPMKELSLIGINSKTIFREGFDFGPSTELTYNGTFAQIMKERLTAHNTSAFARNEVFENIYFEYPRAFTVMRGFSYTRAFTNEYLVAFTKPADSFSALYLSVTPLPTKSSSYTANDLHKYIDTVHEYTIGFEQTDLSRKYWSTDTKTHSTLGYTKITTTELSNGTFETKLTVAYKNNVFSGLIRHTTSSKTEFEDLFYFVAQTFQRTN